jgi:biopolymer transport protein ExbB
MTRFSRSGAVILLVVLALGAGPAAVASGEDADKNTGGSDDQGRKSLLDFVHAGGIVGYAIIALSAAGVALVIYAAMNVKAEKLIPPSLAAESDRLARAGKFLELRGLCQASDNLAARVIQGGLEQGQLGVEAVREAMREQGTREITRLQQRVGYVGLIASVAPMLGLLGTVVGMIGSFDVLGTAKGAARPDELAVGISKALVTTCMGLVVAVPLIFFHSYFRDRVTRISQDLSGLCERLLRIMTTIVELRTAAGRAGPAAPGVAGAAPQAAARDAATPAPAPAEAGGLDPDIESALKSALDGDDA